MIRIEAEGWYEEHQLRILGLDGDGIDKAVEKGELRQKVVGETTWYKGEWLLAWLEGRKPVEVANK